MAVRVRRKEEVSRSEEVRQQEVVESHVKESSSENEQKREKEFDRPFSLRGLTTKIKTPHGSMFVTVNWWEGKPVEVFVVVSKPGSELRACSEALGRVISLALQKGVPAEDIAETLENIKTEQVVWNRIDSRSFAVSSIPDGIAKVLRFCLGLKKSPDLFYARVDEKAFEKKKAENSKVGKSNEQDVRSNGQSKENLNPSDENVFDVCPSCGSSSLAFSEGCYTCLSCGYTKCS